MDNFADDYGRSSSPNDVDPFAIDPRLKRATESSRGRDQQASVEAPTNHDEPQWGSPEYMEWFRATDGRLDMPSPSDAVPVPEEQSLPKRGIKDLVNSVTVFGDRDVSNKNKSRGEQFADRIVGKVLGEQPAKAAETSPRTGRSPLGDSGNSRSATGTAAAGARTVNASDARTLREAASEDVRRIDIFLAEVQERRLSGGKVPEARSRGSVLGAFKGSPINQTRIQVLAAAATARHLEGPDSENARNLNQLVEDNAARMQAIRDEERYRAGIEHEKNGTPQADIDAEEHSRTEREAREDKHVVDAAAAVSLGYVAEQGLPSYEQLAGLSEAQLGPVPEEVHRGGEATSGGRSGEGITDVLKTAGRGLAQAVGPVVGDDDVAANLSPVNVAQVNEELASIVASLAPAMRAAMSSHPRSVKELLNADREPDEKSAFFESEQDLNLELERQQQREHESEHAM